MLQIGPSASGPVDTEPPNVPEFKPAFAGQTRAPAIRTRTAIKVTEIAGDLDRPWAIAFLPDRRMLVTEKHDGELFIVTPDGKKSPSVEGVPPVDGGGQGGLLDVEFGPDFATSKLVYLSYYEPREGGNGLAVARARLVDGAKPRIEQLQVVFRMQPTLDSDKHAGGRLVFAPDGMLFVTLGERSIMNGDELNLMVRGKDYGWPTIGYGEEYSGAPLHKSTQAPGLEQPVYYWDPVISPGALTIYSGDLIPDWKNNFLIAGLSSEALVRLALKGDRVVGEERLLTDRGDRIREVVQGPESFAFG